MLAPQALSPAPVRPLRPFADYEQTGFVVAPALDTYGIGAIIRAIAASLPDDVTLVLYGDARDAAPAQKMIQDLSWLLPRGRLKYLGLTGARDMLWSRDAMPMPAWDAEGKLVVTDAKYWGGFEPDEAIANLLGARIVSHTLRFEGGNLMANHLGACVVVDSRALRPLTDALFARDYGCQTVTRLAKRGGLGHIDERARFVAARTVLTDTDTYADMFAAQGFTIVRVPKAREKYESYVNALVVNGTAFVPQFGRAEDDAALGAYETAGFKTVGVAARTLASKVHGAIHCLTMNYPPISIRSRP
jgi:agmatine/peptidylarginine deiminase